MSIQNTKINNETIIYGFPSADQWIKYKRELLILEKQIFGNQAFEEEDFDAFRNPLAFNIMVYTQNNKTNTFKLIGYLMSQRLSQSTGHKGYRHRQKYWYLESMGLLETYRGKGIGKALMNAYIDKGVELGINKFILDTREKPMIKMAEKYGFVKRRFNGKHFDNKGAWVMIKTIKCQTISPSKMRFYSKKK